MENMRQRQNVGDFQSESEPLFQGRRQSHQHQQGPGIMDTVRSHLVVSVVGALLFLGGVALQFWNEGRAVDRARALDEGLNSVVVLKTPQRVLAENDGKLVHLVASIDVPDILREERYGVAISAIRLKRRVQMYQWIEEETSRTVEGTDGQQVERIFHYHKAWKERPVDSSTFNSPFNHENPKVFPLEGRVQVASVAYVGGFRVSPELRELFNKFTVFAGDERPADRRIRLHTDIYYHCEDIEAPQIGDIRVQFSYAGKSGDTVSVVGRQQGDTLLPYTTSNGHRLLLLHLGTRSHQQLFYDEHAQNRALTWWLRGGGWLLTFIGLSCLTNVLNVLVSRFPVVRDVVAVGVTSLNFSVSVSVSLVTVALSWLLYRPLLAAGLVLAAALTVWWRARWTQDDLWDRRDPPVTVTRPRGLYRAGRTPPPYGFRLPRDLT